MHYTYLFWRTAKAIRNWKLVGFLLFNILGISYVSIAPMLEFLGALPLWSIHLLWGSVLVLTACGIYWVGKRAWEEAERNHLKEKLVLEEQLSLQLEIRAGTGMPFEETISRSSRGIVSVTKLFRIEIHNPSRTTIDRVQVELLRIIPSTDLVLPAYLHLMHDAEWGIHGARYQDEFPLDGVSSRYVDVVSKTTETILGTSEGDIVLSGVGADILVHHIAPNMISRIRPGKYVFTISAHGRKAQTCSKHFAVDIDLKGFLTFTQVADAAY